MGVENFAAASKPSTPHIRPETVASRGDAVTCGDCVPGAVLAGELDISNQDRFASNFNPFYEQSAGASRMVTTSKLWSRSVAAAILRIVPRLRALKEM